jgi:hypothetical protein
MGHLLVELQDLKMRVIFLIVIALDQYLHMPREELLVKIILAQLSIVIAMEQYLDFLLEELKEEILVLLIIPMLEMVTGIQRMLMLL